MAIFQLGHSFASLSLLYPLVFIVAMQQVMEGYLIGHLLLLSYHNAMYMLNFAPMVFSWLYSLLETNLAKSL